MVGAAESAEADFVDERWVMDLLDSVVAAAGDCHCARQAERKWKELLHKLGQASVGQEPVVGWGPCRHRVPHGIDRCFRDFEVGLCADQGPYHLARNYDHPDDFRRVVQGDYYGFVAVVAEAGDGEVVGGPRVDYFVPVNRRMRCQGTLQSLELVLAGLVRFCQPANERESRTLQNKYINSKPVQNCSASDIFRPVSVDLGCFQQGH